MDWRKRKNRKIQFITILVFLVLVIFGLGAFVKFDTPVAAEFTDIYLRPILGNNLVVILEKIYFNFSDKVNMLTFSGKVSAPDFFGEAVISGDKSFNLAKINLNNGFKLLPGENVWHENLDTSFSNKEVMAVTFVRPDPNRPYVVVTLAQMNMSLLKIGIVAGTKQPGGPVGNPGPGRVPGNIVNSGQLVAAFNGGFQYRDGEYGMIVGNKTYLPLKNEIGTLVGFTDGSFTIVDYEGQPLGKDIAFVRQNCPILIENGQISILDDKNKKLWGRTPTTDIYTWRTGVGITKEGNLIYAVGNALTPLTLAQALKAGGAVSAIQLDINPFWVRFNTFKSNGNGGYISRPLIKDLKDGSKAYLSGYEKDFFYLYKKV